MAASICHVASDLLAKRLLFECRAACLLVQRARYTQQRLRQPSVAKVKEKVAPKPVKEEKKKLQRILPPDSLFWLKKPEDDVWLRMYYPRQTHSLEDAISMHRELAQPAMLDNADGLVYLDMKLCMKTKKKTKFSAGISKTIALPHPFTTGVTNKIAVICKTSEDEQAALQMGASEAGGASLIKRFLNSEVSPSDYDFILCTVDILQDLVPLRTILKDSFPSKSKGTLGTSVSELMNLYLNGISYKSVKNKDDDASVATMRVPLGKLSMESAQLLANLATYVESVNSHRSIDLGPVILKASCVCPPSTERFDILPRDLGHAEKPIVAVQEDDEDEAKKGDESDDD